MRNYRKEEIRRDYENKAISSQNIALYVEELVEMEMEILDLQEYPIFNFDRIYALQQKIAAIVEG